MNKKEVLEARPMLEGKRIVFCEHQKKGTAVEYGLWIGDNTRVMLCPVCTSVMLSDTVRITASRVEDVRTGIENLPNIEEMRSQSNKYQRLHRLISGNWLLRWIVGGDLS
jgi:hypothetical protein